MKGIVLSGGAGSRLQPCTSCISKQLLPVYDKPMVFYPISVLMLAGIRDILIISTPDDLPLFRRLLGDGSQLGVNFEYKEQKEPKGIAEAFLLGEEFINGDPVCLVLGDNIFYGERLPEKLRNAQKKPSGATIFGYRVSDPERFGVIEFDESMNVLSIEEKPSNPKSDFVATGLYFFDSNVVDYTKAIKPSARGELEITDINQIYLENSSLSVDLLGRGFTWLDSGTHDSLLGAGQFVQMIQQRQGYAVACLEEIAYKAGWISEESVLDSIARYKNSTYAGFLKKVLST